MKPDPKMTRWSGFPAGLNNREKPTNGPTDERGNPTSLQDAVNVILDQQGKPQRRPGRTKAVNAGRAHSLFATDQYLFAVVDGDIRVYDDMGGGLVLVATITLPGDRYTSFTSDDFDVYWSNGVEQGRIAEDLSLHPFWVGTPNPVTLTAVSAGGLAAGTYEVSVTAVDVDGRESGASSPVQKVLTSGQGIDVTLPATPAGCVRWRVYVTPPDGEAFYQCADLPASAGGYIIGSHVAGAKLETLWMDVIPPSTQLRYGHNRIYAVTNGVVMFSEPYRLGLMKHDSHVVVGKECTLFEPVGDVDTAGCWVADHKRTYWMGGPDPDAWTQIAKYPHAAVYGTAILTPGTRLGLETTDNVAYWHAANGIPCIGTPGGQIIPLREQSLALPVNGERGASGLMMFDGMVQILTSIFSTSTNNAAASDTAEATVRRRTA